MLPVVFYVTKDHVLNHYRDIYIYISIFTSKMVKKVKEKKGG